MNNLSYPSFFLILIMGIGLGWCLHCEWLASGLQPYKYPRVPVMHDVVR